MTRDEQERAKVTEATLSSDAAREVRARLYHESGVLRLVERNGPHLDEVEVDADVLRDFLVAHRGEQRVARGDASMSDKHEKIAAPREWVCSNGTIVTEYGPGAGVLAGRLHLESTAGETLLVPTAELQQFLSDYEMERQLAEVTAERDALKRRLDDATAGPGDHV